MVTRASEDFKARIDAEQQRVYLRSLLNGTQLDTCPSFDADTSKAVNLIASALKRSNGNLDAVKVTTEALASKNKVLSALLKSLDQADVPAEETDVPALPATARLPAIPLEQVSPWVSDYIKYSKDASPEGYEDFHLACALFVLSTVMARRVCIPQKSRQYTPLTFVMCARTSLFAKSVTAYAAIRLIKDAELGYLLGADETTPQKLLYDMAGHVPANYGEMDYNRQELAKLKIAMAGQRGWYYDEFNQLVDAMSKKGGGTMSDFAGLLRKLDNCTDEYIYATKGGGEDYIEKPYLALLASTTPANMGRHMGKGAELWGDGTCARWLFACPRPNDFITATMGMGIVEPPAHLIEQLKKVHERLGVPTCTITEATNEKGDPTGKYQAERETLPERRVTVRPDAFQAYDRYRTALRELSGARGNTDLDGNYSRLSTFALRVAAMLAVLENENLIDLRIWTGAQQIMETFRVNLHEAYNQTATQSETDELAVTDQLISHLKKQGRAVTTREIQQGAPACVIRLKSQGIKALLSDLEKSGIVRMQKEGRKEVYDLDGKTSA